MRAGFLFEYMRWLLARNLTVKKRLATTTSQVNRESFLGVSKGTQRALKAARPPTEQKSYDL